MSKKLLAFPFIILTLMLLISASLQRSSSGAPASHTGAPEEKTCAASGCHDDNAINAGTAQLSLLIEDDSKLVRAGQSYFLKLKLSDADIKRFGFQLVALTETNSENCGTFTITDSLRTQIVQNRYGLKERKYVTYTFNGTDAVKNGVGEWMVKWTAPKDLKGAVTFYYAGVSANDDMSDKGDKTYTGQVTLKQKTL